MQWFMLILAARTIRAFAYGAGSVALGIILAAHGFGTAAAGLLLTLALLSGALFTAATGWLARRTGTKPLLCGAALVMAVAGALLASEHAWWPIVLALSLGVVSVGTQEVGPFAALEQSTIAERAKRDPTRLYAVYNACAMTALAIGAASIAAVSPVAAFRLYGIGGLVLASIYLAFPESPPLAAAARSVRPARFRFGSIEQLAALFALDALAGGFVVQSFLAYWFHVRFGASAHEIGAVLGLANALSAVSFFVAARLAERFGVLETMVFTHLPSNLLLVALAFAPTFGLAAVLLLARFALSQMDVPTRQAFVMLVAAPEERARAAALTNAVRPAAAAAAPAIGGLATQSVAIGLPFVIAGVLKIVYDLMVYARFRTSVLPIVRE